eukprot:scaffold9928_cov112-Isochrysis_galbana.AAC.7
MAVGVQETAQQRLVCQGAGKVGCAGGSRCAAVHRVLAPVDPGRKGRSVGQPNNHAGGKRRQHARPADRSFGRRKIGVDEAQLRRVEPAGSGRRIGQAGVWRRDERIVQLPRRLSALVD